MRHVLVGLIVVLAISSSVHSESTVAFAVRGKTQTLHLYGPEAGPPVVVASGDGGWIHLGVHAAEFLSGRGYSVVGVDVKSYLASLTIGNQVLHSQDVPQDFRAFIEYARRGRAVRVLLVGVSEGAGLDVLAASDPELQEVVSGIIALGLPNQNELGWRFRDSIIWITHKAPNEPLFLAADYIPKLGQTPLAEIHSTHDEYAPIEDARRLMSLAGGPKKFWVIDAADHRFSNNLAELDRRLMEAIEWIRGQRP